MRRRHVAHVNHDFHRAFDFDVADDVVVVFAGDVFRLRCLVCRRQQTVFLNNS